MGMALIIGSGYWFWVGDIGPYLESGGENIDYVVKNACEAEGGTYYSCPPCPRNAVCKPCPSPCMCPEGKYWDYTAKSCKLASDATTDISTWKTYRNEKYGFEVKYPGDWVIKKTIDNSAVYILIFGSPNFSYSSSTKLESVITQGREMGVRIFKYRSHKSPQELNDAIIHDGNLIGIKNTNFKIVGSDRMIYDFVYEETYGHSLHILADSIEIEIGILAGSSESASETRKIFDQILSTFKFSE